MVRYCAVWNTFAYRLIICCFVEEAFDLEGELNKCCGARRDSQLTTTAFKRTWQAVGRLWALYGPTAIDEVRKAVAELDGAINLDHWHAAAKAVLKKKKPND